MSIKTDRAHYARVEQYVRRVQSLYYNVAKYCAQTATMHKPKGDIFYFKDIPTLNRQIDRMFVEMSKSFETTILSGITDEWDMANVNNDDLVLRMRKKVPNLPLDIYHDRNLKALEAFQQRKVGGLNLSERVWKYTSQFKNEIEQSLDIGMAQGRSASEISLDIMKYLQNPDSLREKLITKNGIVHVMNENTNLHPGQGVYRSSYKNAMRLTRTEVNSAYRRSDYERWQQLDFVVGIEIRRSNREYACDVCESLKGKYPKDFKFYGWHPHCRCHAISIMATEKELLDSIENDSPINSKNETKDLPKNFTKWIKDNENRIIAAKEKGTLPYFLRDNFTRKDLSDINLVFDKDTHELIIKSVENRYSFDKILEKIDYEDARNYNNALHSGKTHQGYIGELQGYDGLPTLVDNNRFDELISNDEYIPIYRGFRHNADELVDNFKNGELYHGLGAYGNGSYFGTSDSVALSYTSNRDRNHIVEAVFKPKDMKIANYNDVVDKWLEDRDKNLGSLYDSAKKHFNVERLSQIDPDALDAFEGRLRVVFDNLGSWCTAKGYDMIYVESEDFYVMLNRTKLIVKK